MVFSCVWLWKEEKEGLDIKKSPFLVPLCCLKVFCLRVKRMSFFVERTNGKNIVVGIFFQIIH